MAAGDVRAGFAAADRALGMGGACLWEAEVRRLRAEFLAALGTSSEDIDEELGCALEVARRQGAKMFELRTMVSLLRHRIERGDSRGAHEARDRLAAIVATLSEGRDTGITNAFRDTELLAESIDEGLSGRCPLEEALAQYERRRNEASLPLFELTCEFAALQPPLPEQQQLFAALRHDQEQTDRFFGTVVGTVPISEFFSPENVGRIMASSASATPAAAP